MTRVRRIKTLITSGAYVNSEMSAEFGRLPPSFLPLGTERLYQHQVRALAGADFDVFISLPECFEISPVDEEWLRRLDVTVLRVPPGISLGESVAHCLSGMGDISNLEILHGDTLIHGVRPWKPNYATVANVHDGYSWAIVEARDGVLTRIETVTPDRLMSRGEQVLSGYFSFADGSLFAKILISEQCRFVESLRVYAAEREIRAKYDTHWLDFGHLQTYFRSRRVAASARTYNTLTITNESVTKRSERQAKLEAEAAWFRQLPADLRSFSARLLDEYHGPEGFTYSTEYEYLPTLAELHVFGRLNRVSWSRILDSCVEFLNRAATFKAAGTGALSVLSGEKTDERINAFERSTAFDANADLTINGKRTPGLRNIAAEMRRIIDGAGARDDTIMHGDFCFSNLLYNSRTQQIRVIDPRGHVRGDSPSLYGDFAYDVAKLAHSVIGRYDLIIASQHRLQTDGKTRFEFGYPIDADKDWLEGHFADLSVSGLAFNSELVLAVMVTLFLSMLPLHSDRPDRQLAFVANSLDLYLRFFSR